MYTTELIKEVKELYPDYVKMHELADVGNVMLGMYLDSSYGIAIDDVLLATSLEELQKKARIEKRKANLYTEWCKQDPRKYSEKY